MPKTKSKSPHVTIKIPIDLIQEVDQLVGQHGYKSRGEVAKEAIRDLLAKYQKTTLPRFEHFNMGLDGVRITDRKLRVIADIYFKPQGIWCDLDQSDSCEHIDYALTVPEIRKVVIQRKKEGWKLPDV